MTRPSPTVCPAWEVPPPRAVTGDAELAPERERRLHVGIGPRHDHRERLDLVDRGIGAVAAAIERVEQHLAGDLALQAPGQGRIAAPRHPADGAWEPQLIGDAVRRSRRSRPTGSLHGLLCPGFPPMHNASACPTGRAPNRRPPCRCDIAAGAISCRFRGRPTSPTASCAPWIARPSITAVPISPRWPRASSRT